jgi:hypothetical protein
VTAMMARVNGLLVALVVVGPLTVPIDAELDGQRFPIGALQALGVGRVFHDDVAGGYLIYEQGPQRLAFIDDRAELFGEELLRSAVKTINGTPTWRDVFSEWNIGQALLKTSDGLTRALTEDRWVEVHRDEHFVVLRRP